MREPVGEFINSEKVTEKVNKWLSTNTFHYKDFSDIDELIELKKEKNQKITLAIPTLNEGKNIGKVIKKIKSHLVTEKPLLDEIIIVDSGSTDNTRSAVIKGGGKFYLSQEYGKEGVSSAGKGSNLWTTLYVAEGDIISWIDADIRNIDSLFVYGTVGPLLKNDSFNYTKGFYDRPLETMHRGKKLLLEQGGGRVTEIMARPLINRYFKLLTGFIQPLSGEYAGRRKILEQIPFYPSYSVEIGLLIDISERFGIDCMAQVDLIEREHSPNSLKKLGEMAYVILLSVVEEKVKEYNKDSFREDTRRYRLPVVSYDKIRQKYIYTLEEKLFLGGKQLPPMKYLKGD